MACAICVAETVTIEKKSVHFYMTMINVCFNVSFLDFDLCLK